MRRSPGQQGAHSAAGQTGHHSGSATCVHIRTPVPPPVKGLLTCRFLGPVLRLPASVNRESRGLRRSLQWKESQWKEAEESGGGGGAQVDHSQWEGSLDSAGEGRHFSWAR